MTSARSFADWIGITASMICALHCVLVPVFLITGSVLPLIFSDEFHETLVLIILPTALFAFGIGCWQHKDRWVFSLGAIGLVGITLSLALHDVIGEVGESIGTLISGILLIGAHCRNYLLCRSKDCQHDGC